MNLPDSAMKEKSGNEVLNSFGCYRFWIKLVVIMSDLETI